MTDPNMPNDKHEAIIYLKAKKQAYLELVAEICEHNMTTGSQISGLVFNKIDELDEDLESY